MKNKTSFPCYLYTKDIVYIKYMTDICLGCKYDAKYWTLQYQTFVVLIKHVT